MNIEYYQDNVIDLLDLLHGVSETKECRKHLWTFPEDLIEDAEFEEIIENTSQEVQVSVQDAEIL